MKKIKNNNQGSIFTIVLVAMALFMMVVTVISMQTNNQIKSNSKHYKDMEQKYLAESGIEKTIADISSSVEEELKNKNTKSVSSQNHTGHIPVDLEMNKIRDIANQIVSNNIYNGSNGLGQIYNDLSNLNLGNGGSKLENELYKEVEGLRNDIWIYLGSAGNSLIFELSDYVHNNRITDRDDEGYQTRVTKIGQYIDITIEKIKDIQSALDKLYMDNNNNTDNLKNKIAEIQQKFESVKYYLEEVKCKLGIYSKENEITQYTLNINLPSYKYPNESIYKTNGYERSALIIPVTINHNGTSISSVEAITVEGIKTIGYIDNNEYKMKANITFNIGRQGGNYRVLSYKINKWEKDNE